MNLKNRLSPPKRKKTKIIIFIIASLVLSQIFGYILQTQYDWMYCVHKLSITANQFEIATKNHDYDVNKLPNEEFGFDGLQYVVSAKKEGIEIIFWEFDRIHASHVAGYEIGRLYDNRSIGKPRSRTIQNNTHSITRAYSDNFMYYEKFNNTYLLAICDLNRENELIDLLNEINYGSLY